MRITRMLVWPVLICCLCRAKDPVKAFQLKIVRDRGLPTVLHIGDCISGRLYVQDIDRPLTGAGDVPVGATLELPWRGNQNEISAIPAGSYSGAVRQDGDQGWRIELSNVKGRTNIEIHLGNWRSNSVGCILLGKSVSKNQACFVENSGLAMDDLRKLYASPDHSRPIRVTVVD